MWASFFLGKTSYVCLDRGDKQFAPSQNHRLLDIKQQLYPRKDAVSVIEGRPVPP